VKRARGFTLIELLVTLVIVAFAGAAILARARGLLDYETRLRAHQENVSAVLNTVAGWPLVDPRQLRQELDGAIVKLSTPTDLTPSATLANHEPDGMNTPPIDQAYTPYQTYTFAREQEAMSLLMPGLPRPR
jgi:prepilin-type N-terminal cleavage/methylation domain-containing protein